MKTCISMRAALALGLPAVARGLGRARRVRLAAPDRASHKASRGNVVTAFGLLLFYAMGL